MSEFAFLKLLWAGVAPGNWPIYGLAALLIQLKRGRRRAAQRIAVGLLAGWVAVGALPVKELLLLPLERAYAVPAVLTRVDGIVVLGGAEELARSHTHGSAHVNDAGDRLLAALALAHRFPQARVLVSGSSDGFRTAGAPPLMAQILIGAGLDPARLVIEPRSRNTRENAIFSLPLAKPRPGETWLLVTSAFHMPRAMRIFEQAGWPSITAYPTDFRTVVLADGFGWAPVTNLAAINLASKEYLGLAVARLSRR